MHHAVFYISLLSLHDYVYYMKRPNFTLNFVEDMNTKQSPSFFLNFDIVLKNSTPEKFPNIWQIEWDWVRKSKFEAAGIHFLTDIFIALAVIVV